MAARRRHPESKTENAKAEKNLSANCGSVRWLVEMDPFYRTSFSRHLHSVVVNGFWERYLDADDHEFLEHVKKCGVANGSIPSASAVLLEELEFWHLPYAIAPDIERRVGKPSRNPRFETDEERKFREARTNAGHARREIRKQELAIAAAELAREQREWKEANKTRRLRELMSDLEWEAASPCNAKAKFGATVGRYHVPQWKLDEITAQKAAEAEARKKAKAGKTALGLRLHAKQKRREQRIEAARKVVDQAEQLKQEQKGSPLMRPPAIHDDYLKSMILTLLRGSPVISPHPNERPVSAHRWTIAAIARSVGGDEEQVFQCVKQLVASGKLREIGTVAA